MVRSFRASTTDTVGNGVPEGATGGEQPAWVHQLQATTAAPTGHRPRDIRFDCIALIAPSAIFTKDLMTQA